MFREPAQKRKRRWRERVEKRWKERALAGAVHVPCMWLTYVRLDKARVPWEEEASSQELLVSDWPVDKFVQHFLDECFT